MMKFNSDNSEKLKGFSLVELIIVIAIMAVLIAVLAPQYLRYIEKSKQGKDADVAGVVHRVITASLSNTSIKDRPTGALSASKLSDLDDGAHDDFVEEICHALGTSDLVSFESSALTSNAFKSSPIQVDISSDGQNVSITIVSTVAGVADIVVD